MSGMCPKTTPAHLDRLHPAMFGLQMSSGGAVELGYRVSGKGRGRCWFKRRELLTIRATSVMEEARASTFQITELDPGQPLVPGDLQVRGHRPAPRRRLKP